MKHPESQLQRACKKWFDLQYSDLSKLLIAIPNGGKRSKIEAAIMKLEGIVSGAPDMALLVGRNGYNCFFIEFKTAKGRQSESQKAWQADAERNGSKYVIVRDIESFINEINNYLK